MRELTVFKYWIQKEFSIMEDKINERINCVQIQDSERVKHNGRLNYERINCVEIMDSERVQHNGRQN